MVSTPDGATRGRLVGEDWQQTALRFGPARNLTAVEEAWHLVYRSYRRARLIAANRHELHTVAAAIHPRTLVLVGRINELVVTTMSAFVDGDRPLPLDGPFRPALDQLRAEERRLMEVGLFADRRETIARSLNGLLQLMRYAFFYAIHEQVNDVVIGVRPQHASFYERCFGFEAIGAPVPGVAWHGAPLVPLRLDIPGRYHHGRLPRGLAFFQADPLEADAYQGRYAFDQTEVGRSTIGGFLAETAGATARGGAEA